MTRFKSARLIGQSCSAESGAEILKDPAAYRHPSNQTGSEKLKTALPLTSPKCPSLRGVYMRALTCIR